MAFFSTTLAADTTGKGPPAESVVQDGTVTNTESLIRLLVNQATSDPYYVEIGGSFTYDSEAPFLLNGGTVDSIVSYADDPGLPNPDLKLQAYMAFNTTVDIVKLLSLDGVAAAKYLYRKSDQIEGSEFGDKLAGYKGNDTINAEGGKDKIYGGKNNDIIHTGTGNDKAWGESGKDNFVFDVGDDKDVIKDLSRRKDNVILDKGLAKNFKQVKKAASNKGDDVVLKFGKGDKLTIEDLSKKDLNKVSFSYLDLEI